jgi:predicted dinucleotide-binding enzyme
MKIGVLGSGDVGQTLATGFIDLGHEVKMGSRDPSQMRVRTWLERSGTRASVGTFAEAAEFAEIVVLATLWSGTPEAIRLAGPERFAGKVVIDTTNPLDFSEGIPPKLAVGHTDSAGEIVQRSLPAARVVKAFNTVGSPHMVNPRFPGGPPDMPICGNDADSKRIVSDLLDSLGWSVLDLGRIDCSRYLEPLAMAWIVYFFRTGSGDHAFKLLRK